MDQASDLPGVNVLRLVDVSTLVRSSVITHDFCSIYFLKLKLTLRSTVYAIVERASHLTKESQCNLPRGDP